MLRSCLLFALLLTAYFAHAQDQLIPTETTHDFGLIPQGKPVTYNFVLYNHSKDTLKLAHVEASCGCTTPHWSDKPVLPGDSTTIPVTYNAAGEGVFTKYISLFYSSNLHQQIYIKGEVWKTPDTSVPLNTGIQLVRQ